jgi:signal transduction histidine kinase
VYLAGEDGVMRRVAAAGADDSTLVELLSRETAPSGRATFALTEAGVAKRRELEAPELWDVLGLWSEASRREARALGVSSAVTIPLRGRGDTLGAIVLVETTTPDLLARGSELALAEEFAARAALAIHDARLYEDAKAALRARDEFLVVASHDLRMPLSLLEMQIESMQRVASRAEGGAMVPVARLPRFLDGILRLARQLSIVVEDMLDPTRLTGAHMKLALEEIDLAGLVCTVVARFGDQLAHSGSRVVLSANETAPGEWDRFRLEQVVGNLLSNAIEAGAGKPIEVSVDSDDEHARVHVRDHGLPLTEERKAQLFSLEERAVSARHYGGAGLGLFLARRIVDALGGTIDVETHEGDGTSFTVSLPRRQHPHDLVGAAA